MARSVPSERRINASRLARLDKIKNLLKTKSDLITADEIAHALGDISKRQVQRDIDALESYGVPIVRIQGRGGGYKLEDEYKVTPDPFSSDEVGSISVGSLSVFGHVDLVAQETLQNALAKISASLPARIKREAEIVAERIYFDHSKWYVKYRSLPLLEVLKRATLQELVIKIEFNERDNLKTLQGTIHPYGLVCKADSWYLVGYHQEERIMRRFNLTRISSVFTTEEIFTRNPSFSLPEFWRQDLEEFGKGSTKAVIAISNEAWKRLQHLNWKSDNEFVQRGDSVQVTMYVDWYEWIIDLALVNRGEVVALEPPDLVERIAGAANRIHQLHNKQGAQLIAPPPNVNPDIGVIGLEILEGMSIVSDS